MEAEIITIVSKGSVLASCAALAVAVLFSLVTLREMSAGHHEFIFYAALTVFFGAVHGVLMANSSWCETLGSASNLEVFWNWLAAYLAPSVIGLFCAFGVFWLLTTHVRAGLTKLFFGLTLVCYLYMLGPSWPLDVKGILTLIYSGAWYQVGLRTSV